MLTLFSQYKTFIFIGILVIVLGYITYLKFDNLKLEKTIEEQKIEIVKMENDIKILTNSLKVCENGTNGLLIKIKNDDETNKKALDICKSINKTFENANNVSKDSIKNGVMTDEKSNEVIDLYNNIFSRYIK